MTVSDLEALFDAFNRHDIDGVMRHFAEDAVFYTIAGPEVFGTRIAGREAIAHAFEAVWTAMPDAHWEQHGHFTAQDRAVSEWTFSGTGPQGRVEARGADIFTLREGRIIVKQALRKDRPVQAAA